MKLSCRWLGEYVRIDDIDPEEIGLRLTMSTSEIEDVQPVGSPLKGVVVGRILEVKPHPDSDHLFVTRVSVGKETVQVVSGAPNTRENTHVPVALEGAVLPGITVKKAKLRGVESRGMACSERELGVSDDHSGLWILDDEGFGPGKLEPGVPLSDLVRTADYILDIDNKSITNRPDLWSHYGFARELSAIFERELAPLCPAKDLEMVTGASGPVDVKVEVRDPDLCRRYSAIRMEGIRIERSPVHLRYRLSSLGVRPISNIVDVTNYVMLLTGQPLHAFDADKVSGHIVVRRAAENEQVVTLDGQKRTMPPDALLIADLEKPIGIAGVMGAENSEIDENSSRIIIESANFDPVNIRRTALSLGLRTEASNRFEKSLDPRLTMSGLACSVASIRSLVSGSSIASPLADADHALSEPIRIPLDTGWVSRMLGVEISPERAHTILTSLQFEVEEKDGGQMVVTVPSFRSQKDVTIKQDLVEEIGRVYGYNNVTPKDPLISSTMPRRDELLFFLEKVRRHLSGDAALVEVYTYSFQEDGVLDLFYDPDFDFVTLQNPVSSTLSRLRRSLIPGLFGLVEKNTLGREHLGIYEVGTTYHPLHGGTGELPVQPRTAAALLVAPKGDRPVFFKLKGKLEALLGVLGLGDVRFDPVQENRDKAERFNHGGLGDMRGLHPGRSALASAGGEVFGILSELNPELLQKAGVDFNHFRAAVFELDAQVLQQLSLAEASKKRFTPIPRYPAVSMDMAVVVDEPVSAREVHDFIESCESDLIEQVKLFDIYRGKPLAGGKKSMAFQITYRHLERTLTEQEAKKVHDSIVAALARKGWELR